MNMRVWGLLVCAALCIGATPRRSHHPVRQPVAAEAIEQAQFGQGQKDNTALIVKAEVLLDRSGFSAGVIDGRDGDNYRKALAALQRQSGPDPTGRLDGGTFNALAATSEEPNGAPWDGGGFRRLTRTPNGDCLPICCKLKRAEHPIPLAPSDCASQVRPASARLAANQASEVKISE